MAYMSQDNKAVKAPMIKDILKKYNLKGSLSIYHHSTLVLNIKSGKIDFFSNYNKIGNEEPHIHNNRFEEVKNYIQVNEYSIDRFFSDDAAKCLNELKDVMNEGNHNNSDMQSDYFDVGWYITINIGKWGKPYELLC